jgi:dTDP-glucose 4,6-dehydratase
VRRFVQISTDKVYGSLGAEGRFTEASPLHPNSPFAASNASADLLALSAHRTYGQETVVVRGSSNYGPRQHPGKLIPRTIIEALRNQPLPVFGDGLDVRDWMHVEDFCAAIFAALLDGQPGEIYNVAADNERRTIDVVHLILEHLGKSRDLIQFVPEQPPHDRRHALDAAKVRTHLEWKPRHHYEPALRETIDWYVRHREWWEPLRPR